MFQLSNSKDLYDLIDEKGNLISSKKTELDTANSGYSETVRLPSTSQTTTPSFNEREKYGINTSSDYKGWEEDLKIAKRQEKLEILYKVLGGIVVVLFVIISGIFIKNLLTSE